MLYLAADGELFGSALLGSLLAVLVGFATLRTAWNMFRHKRSWLEQLHLRAEILKSYNEGLLFRVQIAEATGSEAPGFDLQGIDEALRELEEEVRLIGSMGTEEVEEPATAAVREEPEERHASAEKIRSQNRRAQERQEKMREVSTATSLFGGLLRSVGLLFFGFAMLFSVPASLMLVGYLSGTDSDPGVVIFYTLPALVFGAMSLACLRLQREILKPVESPKKTGKGSPYARASEVR